MNLSTSAHMAAAVLVTLSLSVSINPSASAQDRHAEPETDGSGDPTSPQGEPSPRPFSPELQSWLLPAAIGGVEMGALDLNADEVEERLDRDSSLREMLKTAAKSAADLDMAEGFTTDGPDDTWYWIEALRVDGWTGHETLWHALAPQVRTPDLVDTALAMMSTRLQDGREVFVFDADGGAFRLAYAQGNTLYLVHARDGLELHDFMAQAGFGGQGVEVEGIVLTAPQPWWVEPTEPSSHSWLYGPTWSALVYLYDGEFAGPTVASASSRSRAWPSSLRA